MDAGSAGVLGCGAGVGSATLASASAAGADSVEAGSGAVVVVEPCGFANWRDAALLGLMIWRDAVCSGAPSVETDCVPPTWPNMTPAVSETAENTATALWVN